MAGYQRFVAYVYEYLKGKKGSSCGFIKVEVRDQRCRMELHLKCPGMPAQADLRIYGFVRNGGLMDGHLMGSCKTGEGIAWCMIETDALNMNGSSIGLAKMGGLILVTDGGAFFGTEWDDIQIRPENFREIKKNPAEKPAIGRTARGADSPAKGELKKETVQEKITEEEKENKAVKEAPQEEVQQEEALQSEVPQEEARRNEAPQEEAHRNEAPQEEAHRNEVPQEGAPQQEVKQEEEPQKETPQEEKAREAELVSQSMPDIEGVPEEETMEEIMPEPMEKSELESTQESIRSTRPDPMQDPMQRQRPDPMQDPMQRQRRDPMQDPMQRQRRDPMQDPMQRPERDPMRNPMQNPDRNPAQNLSQRSEPDPMRKPGQMPAQQPGDQFLPFGDEGARDCRRIQLKDLASLNRKDLPLRNNRFLQYGYYHFGHLLICQRADGRYILGVPGGYDQQERFMANMFGFPYFKESRDIRLPKGRGGYWYRLINTPDFH